MKKTPKKANTARPVDIELEMQHARLVNRLGGISEKYQNMTLDECHQELLERNKRLDSLIASIGTKRR